MNWNQPNWTRILTILLVILASLVLLYIAASILFRFEQAIFLFVFGSITAYVLTPLVNQLERAFRYRWFAILLSYAMLGVAIFTLGVFLVTPFVQQVQSLVDNLHNPVAGSLRTIRNVESDLNALHRHLLALQLDTSPGIGGQANQDTIRADSALVESDIAKLANKDEKDLENGTLSAESHAPLACRSVAPEKVTSCPKPQTQVPPSYVRTIEDQIHQVQNDWFGSAGARPSGTIVKQPALKTAIANSNNAMTIVTNLRQLVSTTPILFLRSQTWLDQHGIRIDLPSKLGDAAHQVSNQSANILGNAITIVSTVTGIFVNITLIMIIAFYLLMDGRRLIKGALEVVPRQYRDQVWFFIQSLDKVMGGYVRGTIFLSLLAGLLGGGGAAVLGVPYPLLIGIATALLDAVPVIGPLVAFVPAIVISLFFMPVSVTIALGVWFIVFQQIVTNVLGPRIMGAAVGIHPLEALLAVLVGFPLGGFMGAFLAVPLMGIVHIIIRETYAYFVLGHAMPVATVPPEMQARRVGAFRRRFGHRPKPDEAT